VRPPTESERSDLRIAVDGEVVDLRRVRLADGYAVAVERAVLATRCIGTVLEADLEMGSLHEALIRDGMVPSHGKSSIRAEAATRDDAVLLGVATGDPMLVERRLIFDQRGRPIERTESRYAADRYGLNVGFSVEDGGVVTIAPDA